MLGTEKILIVEDDPNIAKMLTATLQVVGYNSEICDNGSYAVTKILNNSYDLILLDVMLPDMDGFEVLSRVKSRQIPIIFLTARQDVTDKVHGLKLGAEDYIVKPFEALELLARIEVVLRRNKHENSILKFSDIIVDIDKHIATKGNDAVSLTPKEFDVLVFFLSHPNIAITRQRLLSAIWGFEFAGESRTVDIHVQQVRRKMGLFGSLVTVPKLGYRLESDENI